MYSEELLSVRLPILTHCSSRFFENGNQRRLSLYHICLSISGFISYIFSLCHVMTVNVMTVTTGAHSILCGMCTEGGGNFGTAPPSSDPATRSARIKSKEDLKILARVFSHSLLFKLEACLSSSNSPHLLMISTSVMVFIMCSLTHHL
jgi:hypothetical protein